MEAFFNTRKPKEMKPDVLADEQWINKGAGKKWKNYSTKLKEVRGPDADPFTTPFDVEVAMLAGEGRRNGRLFIADGSGDSSSALRSPSCVLAGRSQRPLSSAAHGQDLMPLLSCRYKWCSSYMFVLI